MKFQTFRERFAPAAMLTMIGLLCTAQGFAAGPPVASEASNGLAIVLLVVIVALLVIIGLLAYVLLGAAEISLQRFKEKNAAAVAGKVVLAVLCLFSTAVYAADAPAAAGTATAVSNNIDGLSKFSYFVMLSVIGVEVLVIMVMLFFVKALLAKEKPAVVFVPKQATVPLWQTWWIKINSFKPEHEVVDTGHNYDGIREMDNKLPPWWLYGFFACIVFAFVYMYRFHVVHTAPSTIQEYEMAMAKAEVEKEAYLKHAANTVDENTVTLITDASGLAEGKKLFGASCAACHGADAQGVVGPNLTDDYWLHNGGVKDVFKVIKYGVPEKGMKSWKDDFSPVQIANLTGYIKSLKGTSPANAKEPQGDLFKEGNPTASDTSGVDNKIAVR